MTDDQEFYIRPDGIEDVLWMKPHRELIDGLPLPAELRSALHVLIDDVYQHSVEDKTADQESTRRLLGAVFQSQAPVVGQT